MQKPSKMVITLSIISVCVVISIIITLIVLLALNDEPKLETTTVRAPLQPVLILKPLSIINRGFYTQKYRVYQSEVVETKCI